jgi:hypothetical protein
VIPLEVIQHARRVLGSVRTVRLSDEPTIDIQERLALLTVVAGQRDVVAIGFGEKNNEAALVEIQKILAAKGVSCLVTSRIQHESKANLIDEIGELYKVFDRLDAESYAQDRGRLLWAFREPHFEERIQQCVRREISAGQLLGYPNCCVTNHDEGQAHFQRVFAAAIVAAAGRDPAAVERALREDLKVELPGDPTDGQGIERTTDRFPFALHIACGTCLSSEDSPTAHLDLAYRDVARQFDRRFAQLFEEMARVRLKIDRFLDDAEKKGARPDKMHELLRAELEKLFEERNRIYSRFFEP